MRIKKAESLPVFMYHYVSDQENSIAVSRALFEEQCRTLAEDGWTGAGLAEAEAFLSGEGELPAKSVLFTFDDGYLDNYLHALPVLHKYGHKGVTFMISERMNVSEEPSFPLEDVKAGRAPALPEVNFPVSENSLGHKIRRDVFCSRGDLRAMETSGVMAVAAHGLGHYGVYAGPEFTDFVKPGPRLRTFHLTEEGERFGMPEFAVKAGLAHRAFLPNEDLIAAVVGFVPQTEKDAAVFFEDQTSVEALKTLVASFEGRMGRFETDAERRARKEREIAVGKERLEAALGHEVRSLCWPWGKYDAEALSIGKEAGFKVFFTVQEGSNPPGSAEAVRRFKAKAKGGGWLKSRASVYSSPFWGNLYANLRF